MIFYAKLLLMPRQTKTFMAEEAMMTPLSCDARKVTFQTCKN